MRAASGYVPRRPETTTLYGVVQHHLETWLGNARVQERSVPRFVERELRAFLDCGILARGFLGLHCEACVRGRHMADMEANPVDCVLPRVPVRQWVLSLPFGLRYRLAHDRELTAGVLRVFVRAVFGSLRRRTRPERGGFGPVLGGALTCVQ